jgi:acetyltransferase-like isoleucine patch superfamily enzyme
MKFKKLFAIPKKIYHALSYAYSEYEHTANLFNHTKESFAHVGDNTLIQPKVFISHPKRLYIGDNSTIQNRTSIQSMGGVYIGNYVGVGYGSVLMSFVHNYNYCKSIPYDNTIMMKPVVIRDFAWLGWHTMINPGVEIGEGAIVGMGAVVTSDVPPLSIAMGNPATVVGYRSKKAFEACKQQGHTNTHRILETFGRFEEKLPMMMKRKYAAELKVLDMI